MFAQKSMYFFKGSVTGHSSIQPIYVLSAWSLFIRNCLVLKTPIFVVSDLNRNLKKKRKKLSKWELVVFYSLGLFFFFFSPNKTSQEIQSSSGINDFVSCVHHKGVYFSSPTTLP